MFFPLFIGLGLLHYGACGNWSVHYAGNGYVATATCITLQCTYTYPPWHQLKAEVWMASLERSFPGSRRVIVYHTNKDHIHPHFRGRTMFSGQMNGDCNLTINDLEFEDQGEYGFSLQTDQRLFSSSDNIHIVVDRVLSRQRDFCRLNINSPEVYEEEKEGVLTCSADLCTGTLYPQWYNHTVEKITGRTSRADYYNAASLSITPSWQDDGKEIECVADYRGYRFFDTCVKISKTTLHVLYSPKGIKIVLLPSHNEGSNAEDAVLLMCLVDASNPPVSKYTWYKDGYQIPNESMQTIWIENIVKTAPMGRFTCEAHNEMGSSLSSSSNFVTFTETFQTPGLSCTICPYGLLIIILVVAVTAMAISVAVSTWCCLKNKKKGNPAAAIELAPRASLHESGNLVYTNVENPYTALDQDQISPDYEDVKRLDRPT